MTSRTDLAANRPTQGNAFPARVTRNSVAAIISVAFIVFVPLLTLVLGLLLPGREDGESVFSSTGTLLRQAAGDGIILIVLIVLATALGGWRSVLADPDRTRSRWGIAALIVFAAATLISFTSPINPDTGNFLLALATTIVAVALVEELVYRGVVVAGLRRVAPEWALWLVSSAAFALAHAVGGGAVFQVVMTFFLGSACYLARRVTGTILGAVVVHVLYNALIGFRTQTTDGIPFWMSATVNLALVVAAVSGLFASRKSPTQ
ncbi:CPBP family intramembrane glutamic endopeptidase [Frigoribacterium endophyticum]|uniref:CPBP family intramembrane glutamic endopeptidase n=1 Tax=Frigoribacterium endophyticum TaxID=1522176 RepID=UPI0014223E83|nr:CPBP family intramembrane glutamic endopeptidase [Frigoribacterium endophyticum]NII52155.1 hypothetical protein [Frigoribacterium endophyticum]